MSAHRVPAAAFRHEIEVKRSRFIASIARAQNRAEAEAFIARIRSEFADATHNTYAFIAGVPGSTGDIACSDDGEVAGTAGRPMLNLLQHSDLAEIVCVVTRYYGGTLLGTGGLVRAYSQVLKEALAQLSTQACEALVEVDLIFTFALEAAVRRELERVSAVVLTADYAEQVHLQLQVPATQSLALKATLDSLSKGQLRWLQQP